MLTTVIERILRVGKRREKMKDEAMIKSKGLGGSRIREGKMEK